MRTPNPEQQLAIKHTGGVLLSAGAGSGKTFVLIEHIVFLIKEFNSINHELSLADYQTKLQSYLSSIVLMTFTKKAALELMLRLKVRIKEIKGDTLIEEKRWDIARSGIASMTISTIHGFCHKLLASGFFPDFNPEVEIISDTEMKVKINSFFDEWFESYYRKQGDASGTMLQVLIANKFEIVDSLYSIFTDSGLRSMWKDLKTKAFVVDDLSDYFNEYLEAAGLLHLKQSPLDTYDFEDQKNQKWHGYLQQFKSLLESCPLSDKESYLKYHEFFKERVPRKTKSTPEAVEKYIKDMRVMGKFIKENQESFIAYFEHGSSGFLSWVRIFKDIFDYIESHYYEINGVTYSDLEYSVLRGLKNPDAANRISKIYNYFIIDEFQDTSYVQFEIINLLISNDYNRLFCVGDMKQAIYGFRGGEIGVFKSCMKNIRKNLTLKKNYRSLPEIINFNNQFFDTVFKKGKGFEGTDEHKIEVVSQETPDEREQNLEGEVLQTRVLIRDDEMSKNLKLNVNDLNQLEAKAIYSKIRDLRAKYPDDSICVLYKKLRPAIFLISQLLDNDFQFSAQVKIPLEEDPVLGIFKILLQLFGEFKKESGDAVDRKALNHARVMINCYLNHLGITEQQDINEIVNQFFCDLEMFGIEESFRKFMFFIGLSNSNYESNAGMIHSICRICGGDIDLVLQLLEKSDENTYSVDFQVGENSQKLLIMTAHASKGLEFDHVVIGGIHTNGTSKTLSGYFGKIPGSFKWKLNSFQKKAFKSPWYLLESVITSAKNFSESKRLLYVACTRAIRTLSWVDLQGEEGPSIYNNDSWIKGFRQFRDQSLEEMEMNCNGQKLREFTSTPPLFHQDSLGIEEKLSSSEIELGILCELSVTRLSTIVQCSRKFYLQNILRFEEGVDLLAAEAEKDFCQFEGDTKKEEGLPISSAERGTRIHALIASFLKNQSESSIELSTKQVGDEISWIIKELSIYKNTHESISETPLRFSLFGQTITGIPDLILIPKNSDSVEGLKIYDFKTGARSQKKEQAYWFQLYLYGYACYQLNYVSKESDQISLVLAYLDQKELVIQKVSKSQLEKALYCEWKKLANLNQVNREYCSTCQFGNICHF